MNSPTMECNYHNYKITKTGEIYSLARRGFETKIKSYLAKSTGYRTVGLIVNGKHTTRRVARIIAELWLENPYNYKALYVPIEDKPDLETMFWCTTQHLNRIKEAVKHGEEPKRPSPPLEKRVYKPQKPTHTAHGNKPPPEVKPCIAANLSCTK